jgi:hypothetical protein
MLVPLPTCGHLRRNDLHVTYPCFCGARIEGCSSRVFFSLSRKYSENFSQFCGSDESVDRYLFLLFAIFSWGCWLELHKVAIFSGLEAHMIEIR